MENNWFSERMKDEVPYAEIKKKADNGEFHEWNYECSPFSDVEYGYDDVLEKLKTYKAEDYLKLREKRDEAKSKGDVGQEEKYQNLMDNMITDVYNIYREKNIYPTAYYSEFGIFQEIEKCIAYKAFWDGNTVSCGSGVGTTLCKFLFPNLQDTPSKHDLEKKGAESIFAKFNNEQYLRRAIQFCFSYKDGCPVPTAVEGGLRLVGSAPSNFRPMNAKAIYERFCPEGGTIYDYCCVDDETEFFNGKEWKSLADYKKGDKVLQYNEDGTATLVDPIEYIHYKSDDPFYEYNQQYMGNFCLTGNHDVVYRNAEGKLAKIKVDDMMKISLKDENTVWYVPFTAVMNNTEYSRVVSRDELVNLVFDFKEDRVDSESPYINIIDGHVALSDEVFKMSRESRECFLKLLVGNPDGDVLFICRKSQLTQVQLLWNLTFSRKLVADEFGCIDDILGYRVDKNRGKDFAYLHTVKYEKYEDCDFYAFYSFKNELDELKPIYKKDKYCFVVPSHMLVLRRGGVILITGNCGFGGRMLGALSSQKNFKYVGTDPNTETMYHLHQLAEYIEQVTGREDSYELHCCGSEDFRGKPNSIDFAFSSPPYFDLEVYSDEPTQCYNKFPKLEEWLEGYVRQTIKNIAYMLKPGRCYAVNIADFKVHGGETVAYVDEWIRISTEEGMPLFDTVYLGVTARAGSKEQAAGELKKENILIFKKPL